MRIIGLILIAAGIGLGLLWPWVQLKFIGQEIGSLEFKQTQYLQSLPKTIVLSQSENLVRVHLLATFMEGSEALTPKVPVKVIITDRDGIFLSGVVSFPTNDIGEVSEALVVTAGTSLEFNVLNDGEHTFSVGLLPDSSEADSIQPSIAKITVKIVANAHEETESHKALAAILALVGCYLLVRAGRRKERETKPSQRWGRG